MAESDNSIHQSLTVESLKALGNDYFVKKEFAAAETHYSNAIELLKEQQKLTLETPKSSSGKPIQNNNKLAILFTNRAASRLELSNFIGALGDSSEAIFIDPTWTKAYYRKHSALSKLGYSEHEKFNIWQQAVARCESSAWLQKQWHEAVDVWRRVYKKEIIVDSDDLLSRHRLMKTVRERLSTMAHFWNDSTTEERLQYFRTLLGIIGGAGTPSEQVLSVQASSMVPMPLQNYEDLPRRDIEPWCAYFKQLSGVDKTDVFRRIWEGLSDEESDAVIQDLKVFITSGHLATDGIDINIDDDDDVDEDEATNEGENEVKATITD